MWAQVDRVQSAIRLVHLVELLDVLLPPPPKSMSVIFLTSQRGTRRRH